MGGASDNGGNNNGGDTGPANRYSTPKKQVVDFIKSGGIGGAIVRGVVKGFEKSKAKSKAKNEANVEIGLGTDRMSNYSRSEGGTQEEGNASSMQNASSIYNPILSTNVASSGIVTNNGMVAPTTAEVSQATATDASSSYSSDATLLANNKKGRKSTILQKATGLGDSNLNTTKRTLGA